MAGHLDEFKGKKVVLLVCGGNIDTTTFGRCLERGLAGGWWCHVFVAMLTTFWLHHIHILTFTAEGRLVKFNVTVSDRPGGIAELCKLISSCNVSIKDIMHERAWLKDIYSVEVKCVAECGDFETCSLLKKKLSENYERVHFSETPFAIHKSEAL